MRRWRLHRTASALLAVLVAACQISRGVKIEPRPPASAAAGVTSPVKAHLKDGSTVVFPNGVVLQGRFLKGVGTRYDLTLESSQRVSSVPVDEVAAMETFRNDVNVPATVVL